MKIKQMIKNKKIFIYYVLLILIMICLDQYTKILIFDEFNDLILKTGNIHLNHKINGFLNLVLVLNKGIAFGIFNNDFFIKFMPNILVITTMIIVSFLIHSLWKKQDRTTLPFVFIIAGGVGNLIDRFRIGAVVDFIDVYYKNYHWPAFNLADSFIFIGGIIYIIIDYLENKKIKNNGAKNRN